MTNCQWKRQSTGKNPDVIHMGIITHTKKHPIPHVSSLEVTPHSNNKQKKKNQFFLDPWKRRMQGKLLFLGLRSQVKARNHGLGKQSPKRGNYCIS